MAGNDNILKHGDLVSCTQGTSPGSFQSMTVKRNAEASETLPMVNIPMFGMCRSPANPQTAAMTAAASGVFVPSPCVPSIIGQWAGGAPASGGVSSDAICHCSNGGVITKIG